MRIDESEANSIQAHLCGGGCATDTSITEMARLLGEKFADCTIEDIRRVVQKVSWAECTGEVQDVPSGTNEEVWK